jgi:hypothetical protein
MRPYLLDRPYWTRDFYIWRAKSMTLRKRLHAAASQEPAPPLPQWARMPPSSPRIPGILGTRPPLHPPTLSMDEALAIDAAAGSGEEERALVSTSRFGVAHQIQRKHLSAAVPTAAKSGHTNMQCTYPPRPVVTPPSAVSSPSYHLPLRRIAAPLPTATSQTTTTKKPTTQQRKATPP